MSNGPWPPTVEAIRPEDISIVQANNIPGFVIQAVNELLAAKISGTSCGLQVNEIIQRATDIASEHGMSPDRQSFFNQGWLNFESLYRSKGWMVKYESPDYTESFPSYFVFSVKK